MAVKLKLAACSKLLQNKLPTLPVENLARYVQVKHKPKSSAPELHIFLSKLLQSNQDVRACPRELSRDIANSYEPDYPFQALNSNVKDNGDVQLSLQVCPTAFAQNVLQEISQNRSFWLSNPSCPAPQNFVVEYSSPNIAKPFHVGHLRSTIIGNFVSNLLKALNHRVVRLNYLGDWGTQFGLLKLGLDKNWFTREEIQKNPTQSLYKIYVRANSEAEKDPEFAQAARSVFKALEQGDTEVLRDWAKIRDLTVEELKAVYARLGVYFDEYYWESMYGLQEIQNVVDQLKAKKVIMPSEKGSWAAEVGSKKIPVIKSDGSTLYITRDIAAAKDRFERYKFDRMFYVVDNAQTDHFVNLKEVLRQMEEKFADHIEHIKFGRVQGMSTRKGKAVFLSDLLDEARERMKEAQSNSKTTKVDIRDENSSEILGVSAVLVNDMKQRRQKDYTFQWDKILQAKGDTGIRLQYTHCRLCSLEQKFAKGTEIACEEIKSHLLREKEAVMLLTDMARMDQVLLDCYEQLEPCILINYLFQLSHSISEALAVLPIKNQPPDTEQARYVLFKLARQVLHSGMQILGLRPLESM